MEIAGGFLAVVFFWSMELAVFDSASIFREPDNVIPKPVDCVVLPPRSGDEVDLRDHVIVPKHLIHHRPDAMDVFITDLHEDGTRLGEQIARDSEAVAEVGEVAVDAVAPSVAEGFDLLRLARDVVGVAVLHIAARR